MRGFRGVTTILPSVLLGLVIGFLAMRLGGLWVVAAAFGIVTAIAWVTK